MEYEFIKDVRSAFTMLKLPMLFIKLQISDFSKSAIKHKRSGKNIEPFRKLWWNYKLETTRNIWYTLTNKSYTKYSLYKKHTFLFFQCGRGASEYFVKYLLHHM